ncbi:NADH dehydrogenase [Candidatus Anstonella stagnisolia]|nr:NADH dehydrogenase [Candidatus Anstonella stagnisolia]
MDNLGGIIYPALQAAFIFLLAPLVVGIMRKVKAAFQSRSGAPIYQPYIDIAKLFMKGMVISETSSWVFLAAPIVTFASVAIAAGMLPLIFSNAISPSTLIIFIYLFAIGRFMTALSAIDTGSAFGGIGASREMLFSALIEPVLFGTIIFFSTFGGTVPLVALSANVPNGYLGAIASPELWLAAAAIFIAILAETGRLPFDNPATHLELTMVHEAMILDHSGPLLALIEWANSAKIVAFFGFFAILMLPMHQQFFTGSPLLFAAAFSATIIALAIITATIESVTPKLRLFKISKLLIFSLVLSFLAFLIRISGGAESGSAEVFLSFVMLFTSMYFIFSATFKRRLEIFVVQSATLALILALVVMRGSGGDDALWRLASTIIFKLIIVPILLLKAFNGLKGESKDILNTDPVFMGSPVGISGSFVLCAVLIALSYAIAPVLGIHNQMLPAALSIILIGCLIIATKPHVMLQLMGFLILENGLVLLPTALLVQVPIIGEIIALFDTLTLVAVALVLMFKINAMAESLDIAQLSQLREER